MPSSVKTIIQNLKPDKKFAYIEKSGFVSAAECMFEMVTDLLNIGAMSIIASNITDNVNGAGATFTSNAWPIGVRDYQIVNSGSGYTVGEQLLLTNAGANSVPYSAKVATVWSTNNGIKSLTMSNGKNGQGEYPVYTSSSIVQPNPLVYTDDYIKEKVLKQTSGWFINLKAVTNADGSNPDCFFSANLDYWRGPDSGRTTRGSVILATGAALGVWNAWRSTYGPLLNGVSTGRLPGNVILCQTTTKQATVALGEAPDEVRTPFQNIKVGQRVFLECDEDGVISNANTTIVSITTVKAVIGLSYGTIAMPTRISPRGELVREVFREHEEDLYMIRLSHPVTLSRGANVSVQGLGATVDNSVLSLPDEFTTVLESRGACDPLSDTLGVVGSVVSGVSNSNVVNISSLVVGGSGGAVNYGSFIYEGQQINNIDTSGSGIQGATTVLSVNMTSATTATVTMSRNQTLSTNKSLQFRFDPPQYWRLLVRLQNKDTAVVAAGTSTQFNETCTIPAIYNDATTTITDLSGVMGVVPTGVYKTGAPAGTGPLASETRQGFINRTNRVRNQGQAVPLNSILSVTDRGMFFGAFEGTFSVLQKEKVANDITDHSFNWFLIQRPVNRTTGKVFTKGNAPLFCINSVGYAYHKFIVRETDIFHPSQGPRKTGNVQLPDGVVYNYRTPADQHSYDSFGMINSSNQIALTEDNKYLISFLQNLTTARFRYTEELDIIAQTSADVLIGGVDLNITAYQESTPRTYRGLPSNKPYNTGLRLVVLKNI